MFYQYFLLWQQFYPVLTEVRHHPLLNYRSLEVGALSRNTQCSLVSISATVSSRALNAYGSYKKQWLKRKNICCLGTKYSITIYNCD